MNTEIPVTGPELEREALRMLDRDGMPDDATFMAELVLGYLNTVDKRHHPIKRRAGWSETCAFDNHRWPCAEVVGRSLPYGD